MNDQNRYRGSSAQRYPTEGRSSWNRDDESALLDRGNSPRQRADLGRFRREDESDSERAFNEQAREHGGGNRGYARSRDDRDEWRGFGAQSGSNDRFERDWGPERDRRPDRDHRAGSEYGSGSGSFRAAPRPGPGYNDSRDDSTSSYDSRVGGYGSRGYGSPGVGSEAYGSEAYGSRPYRADEHGSRVDPYGSRSDTHGLRPYAYGRDRDRSRDRDGSGNDSAYSIATRGVSYTGRGPKGYTRSDERIREDICERLSDHDEVDASEIEVQVKDRRVTLTGSVQNRRMKHLAEDLAEEVSGVDDIDNRVTVTKPFFKDIADRLTGNEGEQHYAHSGTKNGSGTSSTSSAQSANGRS